MKKQSGFIGTVIVLLALLGSGCVTTKSAPDGENSAAEAAKTAKTLTKIDANWGIDLPAKMKMDRQVSKGFVVASFVGGKPAKEVLSLYSGRRPSPSCKISTPMQIQSVQIGDLLWKKAACDGNAKTEYLLEAQAENGEPIYIHVFKTERGSIPAKSEARVESLLARIQRL